MDRSSWKKQTIKFLTAQTISLFGSSLVQYAIIWYITLATSSGRMLTFSTLCGFLPQVAISLFAGVWIDRYDRKKLIMLSDGAIAVATLILAVGFLTGHESYWLLFTVLAIRSAGSGIQAPAVNALLPQIVPRGQLMRVNGVNNMLSSLIMFLSPAVSGAILSGASLEATLLVDVVTAVIGVSITAVVKCSPWVKGETEEKSHLEQLKEGLFYVAENSSIRRLLIYQLAVLFLISPSAFLTPLLVSRNFGAEVWRLTASEMTYSLGMAVGGLLIASWGGFKNRIHTTVLAGAVYGLMMLGLGTARAFPVYLTCNLLIGITAPCYNTPITVSLQERVKPSMHGRVFSLMQIATSYALPLGMAFFGPLADIFRVQALLVGAGIAVLVVSIGTMRLK